MSNKHIGNNKKTDFNQLVLLNKKGQVIYSCETLIKLKPYSENPILDKSPFLESIFPLVLEKNLEEKPLRYMRLEKAFPGLDGLYDFSFSWVEIPAGKFILWNIYDYSELYKTLREAQQLRNEKAIIIEKLARLNKRELSNWKK